MARARTFAEPATDRRTAACGYSGEHEECDGFHPGPIAGTPATDHRGQAVKCSCACHVDPWPFEHDG